MIFITVGSQKFQFNRLLEEVDRLIQDNKISTDEVFAQIGYSTYIPQYYPYKNFLDRDAFLEAVESSEIIITHGGTGSIVNSVKKGKKVITVPRTAKFGEHVDDHQFEIIEEFSNNNLVYAIKEIHELEEALTQVEKMEFRKYESNTENIIEILEDFLLKI
ncbi:multidrug MFS transporter [Paenibacillus sp. CCS19]|uniref:PssE/Cps14G family polysaccharide biosynthesis glycosyltransferase n=1 Tax=Paenibacillus sp. CCS19 TaxID=3158387 RepID=UPI0025631B54|nr:PssE/Cps14G family polysaccharide biosynthesis glycosyltransferase [Paenibacillus cellulosilyticus]GMK38135.1 multidrug MFS transporter [Paenibacillus cellulosilyticus]